MYIVITKYDIINNRIGNSCFEVVNTGPNDIHYDTNGTSNYIIGSINKIKSKIGVEFNKYNTTPFLYTYTLLDEEPTAEELNITYKEQFNKIIEKLRLHLRAS